MLGTDFHFCTNALIQHVKYSQEILAIEFCGSENAKGRYIEAMERVGATDLTVSPIPTARTISKMSRFPPSTMCCFSNRIAWPFLQDVGQQRKVDRSCRSVDAALF